MTASMFILAAEQTNLTEELEFLGTGLMVVLVTLMMLALITTVVGKMFERQASSSKKKAPSVVPKKPEGIPAEEVAVIVAAVAAAIDQSHRIAHMGPAATGEGAWALGSRFQHHTSHKPRRDKR
jgi:Na+-transporting methylmalonyl-CoA/oxaloacetate decarboxylase gamma subunit